jgi:hypothetical protein
MFTAAADLQVIYVHRQQTRHQDLTIVRANEHFHDCSGGHFKIFPWNKVNTEGDFINVQSRVQEVGISVESAIYICV